jgi:hypothetical protein
MDESTLKWASLVFMWVVSLAAGISLVRSAFNNLPQPGLSRLQAVLGEIRFRLRLVAGIVLLFWVIGGVFWVLWVMS